MKRICTSLFFLLAFCLGCCAIGEDHYSKALQAIKIENFQEAFKHISKAIELNPTNLQYKKDLAFIQFKRKALQEALDIYQSFETNGDVSAENYLHIIEVLAYGNQNLKALPYIKKINQNQLNEINKIVFYKSAGQVYDKINYYPQAIECFKNLSKLEPNNKEANLKIARNYSSLTNYKEAVFYFEKAILQDPSNAKLLFEIGFNYLELNDRPLALASFLKAKAAGYPDDLQFNTEIATTYYEMKDYKNAIIHVNKAREISPYNQDIASLTAYSYYKGGNTNEARKVINEMMELNPSNADLIYMLGMTYQKDGKDGKAEKLFEQAIKMKPELQRLRTTISNF